MEVLFFENPTAFREWLSQNHDKEQELWVGYYKKATQKPSMTWSESVDQAICFGWIDGIRKTVDEGSYKIRFTPRRPNSIWSNVNIKKVEELTKQGLMMPTGLAAYEKWKEKNSRGYSYEQKNATLAPEYLAQIKAHPQAWAFFENLSPSYKKTSIWWIMSAKRKDTQLRRLKILIDSSTQGLKIPALRK